MSPKRPRLSPINIPKYNIKWHHTHLFKRLHAFYKRLQFIVDFVVFFAALFCAVGLYTGTKLMQKPTNNFIQFKDPQKTKHNQHLSKAVSVYAPVYKLTPRIHVDKYKTKKDIYGYKYKVKRKHKKITYLANFYLDPNYASKSNLIKTPVYVLIKGEVEKKYKTPTSHQHNFNDKALAFDSSKHFVLDDSKTYIKVMQLHNYFNYNNKPIPNVTLQGLTNVVNSGPSRYLKLSEFKLKRIEKINASDLANKEQLFCGYNHSLFN